jgi:hypothetical protein
MCRRLLYPIDAMPFDVTDSRGICDVTAVRVAGASLPSGLANNSRETHRSESRQKVFALIGGTTANRYHVAKRKVERKPDITPGVFRAGDTAKSCSGSIQTEA